MFDQSSSCGCGPLVVFVAGAGSSSPHVQPDASASLVLAVVAGVYIGASRDQSVVRRLSGTLVPLYSPGASVPPYQEALELDIGDEAEESRSFSWRRRAP